MDFVLYGENTFTAIEVKNTDRLNKKMLKGLLHFKEDYPEAQLVLLYRGKERIVMNGCLCIPCDEFLLELVPDKDMKSICSQI